MLNATCWEQEDLRVADVRCTADKGWSGHEAVGRLGIVFVRHGRFHRQVHGSHALVDAGSWYIQIPGTVERFYHSGGVDVCLSISWSEPLYAVLGAPHDDWPLNPQLISRQWLPDLVAIVRQIKEPQDAFNLSERLLSAAGSVTTSLSSLRTAVLNARAQDLADQTRDLLSDVPCTTLWDIARQLHVSPYVLSQTFQAVTGLSVSRYRRRMRLHHARYLVEEGLDDLAQVAVEAGFADQAHFTRAMRAEWNVTPGVLRKRIRGLP